MSDVLATHRWLTLLLALLFAVVSLSITSAVSAQGLPEHSHLMIQGIVVDDEGEPVGYRRCQLLAAGNRLPNHAHHANLHDEDGSGHQGLARGGHLVIPGTPLTPFDSCATFASWFEEEFG